MALYTMSFYGQPKNGDSEMNVAMQVIDIYHEEQLAEHFLCNVNKLGQVRKCLCKISDLMYDEPTLGSCAADSGWPGRSDYRQPGNDLVYGFEIPKPHS